MKIRDAIEADLSAIVEIYNAAVPSRIATGDTKPVTVESRRAWFYDHSPSMRPLWVMEAEEIIIAWLSFNSFYGRPAYEQTAELSIYISPQYRGRGMGQKLLQQAIEHSPRLGLKNLVAFIFAHNEASLRLFEKNRFQQWGYLPLVAELDGVERDLVILGLRVG
ncbi:MAG: N-acetyltransferase [Gomphosphaeria aponina SAG 52.96 = DSM 107014]|uniref:N-acetyltransferase n=1 Tax=Gomphosphaeria aponina SAG 52.96 = DSM 107014 TaxID=1521640 RepID=A0A941JST9_9CHRO|nr:N-acetyltransferase [Gomphosphaeria aponina SAG 52.96 = DSM 107014]